MTTGGWTKQYRAAGHAASMASRTAAAGPRALSAAPAPGPRPRPRPSAAVPEYTARQVWDRLKTRPGTGLVDVRSRAEWAFVGIPDLASLGREVIFAEWPASAPPGAPPGAPPDASAFSDEFIAALTARINKQAALSRPVDELAFICRSGQRSRAAAQLMTRAGWPCCNVSDGFEGDLNTDHHRATLNGWKVAGLPWRQN